jgi:hypothetical protein
MKFLTLQLDENTKIDINNTIWGKETIFYNEEMVSEKTSLLGAVHEFQKEENGHPVSYRIKVGLDLMRGVVYDIFRNEKQVFTNHGNTAKPVKSIILILIGFLGGILGYLVTTSWLGNLSDTGKLIKGTLIICGITAGFLILVSSGRKK